MRATATFFPQEGLGAFIDHRGLGVNGHSARHVAGEDREVGALRHKGQRRRRSEGDADVHLACAQGRQRVGRVGKGHQIDVDPLFGGKTLIDGDKAEDVARRRIIGQVDILRLGRVSGSGSQGQRTGQCKSGDNVSELHSFFSLLNVILTLRLYSGSGSADAAARLSPDY